MPARTGKLAAVRPHRRVTSNGHAGPWHLRLSGTVGPPWHSLSLRQPPLGRRFKFLNAAAGGAPRPGIRFLRVNLPVRFVSVTVSR